MTISFDEEAEAAERNAQKNGQAEFDTATARVPETIGEAVPPAPGTSNAPPVPALGSIIPISALAYAIKALFAFIAKRRGDYWSIDDGDADVLAAAWSPVLDAAIRKIAPHAQAGGPLADALVKTGMIVGSRMAQDKMKPDPNKPRPVLIRKEETQVPPEISGIKPEQSAPLADPFSELFQ